MCEVERIYSHLQSESGYRNFICLNLFRYVIMPSLSS